MKEFFSKIWKWVLANKVLAGIIGGASVVALTLAIVLPVTLSKHTHTFEEAWSKDTTSHWHAATCGHDEKGDEANHTFGNWIVLSETKDKRTCSVCGYVEERNHEHTFEENWSYDDTQHWHAATCNHKVTDSLALHTFSNWTQKTSDLNYDERSCTVCGYKEERDHEHFYSSDWDYDNIHHWHNASCSHTSEQDDYEEHLIPTKKIGTYVDSCGSKFDVYKDTCDCGLICYKVYDVDSDSSYYETVISFTLPKVDAEGTITFYPDCKSYSTTLSVIRIGGNRVINNGDLFVERAYDLSTKGTKCYAQVNPFAYNCYSVDDDNFYMAIALSQDPDWKFEISEELYDASRHVDYGKWSYEPWYGTSGTFRIVYLEGGYEEISVPAINVAGEWDVYENTQGDYSDGYKLFVPKEDASFFSLIDDIYLREKAIEYLCYDEAGLVYDFKKSNCATYCGLAMSGYAEWDSSDNVMVVVASIVYGKLNTGDTLYYYTQFNTDGTGKGTPSTVTVDAIYQYNGETSSPTSVTPPVYGVGTGEFVLLLKGTGLGTAAEKYFGEEDHSIYLSSGGSTQLAHIYDEMYN